MPFALDRRSAVTLRRQLDAALRGWIAGQPQGTLLPSTRKLARQLGVSRNTVMTAYEELAADGLIQGTAGSGTRIIASPRYEPPLPPDWRAALRESQYPAEIAWARGPEDAPILLFRPPC